MIANKTLTCMLLSAAVFTFSACTNAPKSGDEGGTETGVDAVEETVEEAAQMTVSATLSSDQQTEEVTSEGSGTLQGTFDETTGELTFELSWNGLTGPPSMMHFHGPAAAGENAGVKIGITGFPTEASGSLSQTVTVEEADRADLLAGKWYVNIHTEKYGSGEIRGQVELGGAAN